MLSGPFVFVDVDTQRDFLDPAGTLFIPGSEAIVANLARLTRFARQRRIPILATACAHTEEEPDPDPFPPHCLIGTPGQERIEATAWTGPGSVVVEPRARFEGTTTPSHLTIHKQRYDAFSHPDLDRIIRLYAAEHPTFVVYGVATDYCVKAMAEGLLRRGSKVALVADAIRPVDSDEEGRVLTALVRMGAVLTNTNAVCNSDPHPEHE